MNGTMDGTIQQHGHFLGAGSLAPLTATDRIYLCCLVIVVYFLFVARRLLNGIPVLIVLIAWSLSRFGMVHRTTTRDNGRVTGENGPMEGGNQGWRRNGVYILTVTHFGR